MSEYWKSTPNYWCKHCKVYVRDTKFERTQHEATGRHQGNLKRFLRDLHRDHEREQRERDRAKAEVERLNGVVSGRPTATADQTTSAGLPRRKAANAPLPPASRQATAEERKRQMAQLAELGVAIPQEFRGEMAMAGEWQVVSETVLSPAIKDEDQDEDDEDAKDNVSSTRGSKRKYRDQDDDERGEDERPARRKGCGSTIKTYPGSNSADVDLDALLSSNRPREKSASKQDTASASKQDESGAEGAYTDLPEPERDEKTDVPGLKREPSDGQPFLPAALPEAEQAAAVKADPEARVQEGEVFFKKRKAKNIRQK